MALASCHNFATGTCKHVSVYNTPALAKLQKKKKKFKFVSSSFATLKLLLGLRSDVQQPINKWIDDLEYDGPGLL